VLLVLLQLEVVRPLRTNDAVEVFVEEEEGEKPGWSAVRWL